MKCWLNILIICLLERRKAMAQDVLVCGGFLKSDISINFSVVDVKLYTKQGSLKYQTDCAPNNGYYSIPLYDKGDYVLKVEPPKGWSFQPKSVALHIDGSTDPCSKGQDINFYFKGFSVLGKVISHKSQDGPPGIKITLTDSKTKKLQQETVSGSKGEYAFENVYPGSYIVTASHPIWKLLQPETTVLITGNNENNGNSLVVAGYDVKGEVTSDNEPIRGVKFILYSPSVSSKDVDMCVKTPIQGYVNKEKVEPLCYVMSEKDGHFTFPVLLPGDYYIIPFYKGEQIKFDVAPLKVSFKVGHNSLVLAEKFTVQGFSVGGRVLSQAGGKGIPKARVLINGKQEAETRNDGQFHLENMKAGTYTLQVAADNIFFDSIEVKITPNTPQLPDVIAKSFNVCGKLDVTQLPEGFDTHARRSVVIHNEQLAAQPIASRTDNNGQFCIQVSPGKYTVKPLIAEAEESVGLRLFPTAHTITVTDSPLNNVVFKQFFATVTGKVSCFGPCTQVQVGLKQLIQGFPQPVNVGVTSDGKFTFESIMPGSYKLTVSREHWCWQQESLDVTVSSSNVNNLQFVQTGFNVIVEASHEMQLEYTSKDSNGVFDIQRGFNQLCIKKKGLYDFRPLGCHIFNEMSLSYNTDKPAPLIFTAVQHLLTGEVLCPDNVTDIEISVSVKSNADQEDVVVIGPLKPEFNKELKKYIYQYSHWAQYATHLKVKPSASRLLFTPSYVDIQMPDDCFHAETSFEASKGLFKTGTVHPPIEGVTITLNTVDAQMEPVTVVTKANGQYQIGPLPTQFKYDLTAHKDGYVMSHMENSNDFTAFKLAEVITKVVTESGEPLPGVLLSLSGGVDYRQNSQTQENGKMNFLGLSPGEYFLRPVLKEYNFNPPSTMVPVKEGATVEVKLVGNRIAYSCYGSVTSLTSEAEAGVVVEAIGTDQCSSSLEEAVSETDGSFRIRGLLPDCTYRVGIKRGVEVNQHIERATPMQRTIKVAKSDLRNLRIIVFRHLSSMDVSGNVVTPKEHLSTLKVRLIKDGGMDQTLQSISLSTNNFFHFNSLPIDGRTYFVRLETSLSPITYDYVLPQMTFKANSSYKHVSLSFSPRTRPSEHEVLLNSSYLAITLAIIAAILGFTHPQLIPVTSQVVESMLSMFNPKRSGENAASDSSNRRRKIKPRKMQ